MTSIACDLPHIIEPHDLTTPLNQAIVERYFNFNQAEKVCVSEGGHVTSIHNLFENEFIVGRSLSISSIIFSSRQPTNETAA
jgi:hypothetical protein